MGLYHTSRFTIVSSLLRIEDRSLKSKFGAAFLALEKFVKKFLFVFQIYGDSFWKKNPKNELIESEKN